MLSSEWTEDLSSQAISLQPSRFSCGKSDSGNGANSYVYMPLISCHPGTYHILFFTGSSNSSQTLQKFFDSAGKLLPPKNIFNNSIHIWVFNTCFPPRYLLFVMNIHAKINRKFYVICQCSERDNMILHMWKIYMFSQINLMTRKCIILSLGPG